MDEVGKDANLERRVAVYRCRMRCPQHLWRDGMPLEKSISLRTDKRSVALERLPAARLELMEFFQRGGKQSAPTTFGMVPSGHRSRRPDHPDLPLLTSSEAERLAKDFFACELAALDIASADLIRMSPDERERWQLELEDRIAALDQGSADCEDPALGAEIRLLRKAGRRATYDSEPSRLFRGFLRRAIGQLWCIELARARGDYRDRVTDRMYLPSDRVGAIAPNLPQPSRVAAPFHLARQAFEDSEVDGDDAITAKTRAKKRAALTLLERHFGRERDLATLTGSDCRAFRDLIARLPPNLTKRYGDNVPLEEMADANGRQGGPSMSHATQGLYLRLLNNLLAFAKSDGLIAANPFPPELCVRGKKGARDKARNSYSDTQLRAIFTSPLYTGCVDDMRLFSRPLPGHVVRRSRFWLPLIALFSGLRMNEILQLTKWHLQTASDGLPCLLIADDMRVKTKASYRVVPIHWVLIRAGLLAYVDDLADADTLLFDDVPPGPDGYASSTFSKRYATFWKSLNATEPDRKVSFHSFRHNFRDALRVPGADEALIKEVGGWSRGGSVSDSYGDGARAAVLRPIIDAVSYDLDLVHLYTE